MSDMRRVPDLAAGQVAAFMTEVATGILLRKDKRRSLDGRVTDCYFVFDSLAAAVDVAEHSVEEDPSIEWVVVDQNGNCLRMVRAEPRHNTRRASWLRRVVNRLTGRG